MRTLYLIAASCLSLWLSSPARAGLYLPPDLASGRSGTIPWPVPDNPKQFYSLMKELQSPVTDDKTAMKLGFAAKVIKEIDTLESKRKAGELSPEDGALLGGYYLLRLKADQALGVLTEVEKRSPTNFIVLGHLALAYQMRREPTRAVSYQRKVLANWPREHAGWTAEQLRWYRRVEIQLLNLLQQRERETLLGRAQETPEELFPGFRFVAPSGKYEAGALDINMKAKLPMDAMPLVQQLLMCIPLDSRLFWAYAEILNAQGEVAIASTILDKDLMYNRGYRPAQLRAHRNVLREALEKDPRFKPSEKGPVELPITPGGQPQATNSTDSTDDKGWLPNVRDLGVGFISGLVVGVLLLFQFRQFRRRPVTPPAAASKT
jgi:tetratricopeptide (TPR) repeat protein